MTREEKIAHDIVCIIKYGSPGGSATTNELKRTLDYLQRAGLVEKQKPVLTVPKLTIPPLLKPIILK